MADRRNERFLDSDELILAEMPDELALAMTTILDGVGDLAVSMAIEILRKLIDESRAGLETEDHADALERVVLVDHFIMRCLIVEEDGYFEAWENHSDEILGLLTETEQLLLDTAPVDLEAPCYKTASPGVTPACLVQRLNAYLAISAGFSKDAAEFSGRLIRAVDDTIQNVSFLLKRWDRSELLVMEQAGGLDECMPNEKYWTESLSLISYAAVATKTCIETRRVFENRYIPFLEQACTDIEGVRGRLLTDAELTISGLLSGGLDEIGPSYPLDFSAGETIRGLIAENKSLPIVVFSGPEGTGGAYCHIDRAEVIELLNTDTHYGPMASVETNHESLQSRIASHIREREGENLSDEEVAEATRMEAAVYDRFWEPVIAIYTSWKKL